ncbi:MAG: hypothetical protein HUU06_10725, partial [Planctomycetaceae bacterium]|nr:hypothetical protein [Planctomycetaceae bacterium]
DPARARLLGYLHRLARALVVSRAPDLEDLEGRTFRLPPAPFEPADFPDPESGWGQDLIREATAREEEREEPLVAADAERAFDTWIRLLLDRRNSHGSP